MKTLAVILVLVVSGCAMDPVDDVPDVEREDASTTIYDSGAGDAGASPDADAGEVEGECVLYCVSRGGSEYCYAAGLSPDAYPAGIRCTEWE